MDKMVYFYDANLKFDHVGIVSDGEDMPKNATAVAPEGYEPFSYNASSDSWTGGSKEEWEAAHPSTPTEPTETDKLKAMVGNLVAENAKKDQVVESLQKMIGQSITDSAQKK